MDASDRSRVVIITGASRGLGRELALRFGKGGDFVVVNYHRDAAAAAAVVDAVKRNGADAVTFRADVGRADEVDAMVADTVGRWGRVDVLVNNAGIAKDGLLLRMKEQDWDDVMNTNLTGVFHGIRAVSPVMIQQRSGHIISIASIVGLAGREGQANYAAAKAGIIGLTKACAKELGSSNIKVNAVLPGYLPTDMGETVSDSVLARIKQANALGKVSCPGEAADFVYYLSRLDAVSGQVFNLDSRIT